MVNSKAKGGRGERQWVKFLKDKFNVEARRGAQYCGHSSAPDVISNDQYYWEVKRCERLDIYQAVEQAVGDSEGSGKVPAVAWKKNGKEWLVVIRAVDLMRVKE